MYPRNDKINKEEKEKMVYAPSRLEASYDLKESFLFNELTMTENIWLNISSEESFGKGGMTN